METQLREISKAIEKLERIGVDVPDAFRSEKTRLVARLSTPHETISKLNHLTDGLEEILIDLKIKMGWNSKKGKNGNRRSHSPKTDDETLRKLIIEALRFSGGSATKKNVLIFMEDHLKDNLLPGDLEWRESAKEYAWQNNVAWERYHMVQEGVLRKGSPAGIWELTEEYK